MVRMAVGQTCGKQRQSNAWNETDLAMLSWVLKALNVGAGLDAAEADLLYLL